MKNRPVHLSLCCLRFFVVLVISTLWFSSPSQAQVYTKDNNVWVYTELFVTRFGFSPEYATTELKGAQAIAIRLVPLTRSRCHKTDKGEECVPSYQWLLDLYIDLDQDVGIEGNAPRQFKPWRSSLYFLARKDPSLQTRWEEAFGLKGGKLYLVEKDGTRRPVEFDIFSYKRPIKEGLQIIQARINDDIILADPDEARVIEFENSAGTVIHRITIPTSYWPRVEAYRKQYPDITPINWQGGVEQDPHIWVYSKEFADKYNMSLSGISSEMEGAMAMAFRMDNYGIEDCGYFNNPENCRWPSVGLWDIYLPDNTKLYYADDTINNFYKGYHSSASNIHERTNRSDRRGTYPHLIEREGLPYGTHIYRYQKRKFFNLVKTAEMSRWIGGGIGDYSYIQPQVLDAGFTFIEFTDSRHTAGDEQYFVFNDSVTNSSQTLFTSKFYKTKIPTHFMLEVLQHEKSFREKHRLQTEVKGSPR